MPREVWVRWEDAYLLVTPGSKLEIRTGCGHCKGWKSEILNSVLPKGALSFALLLFPPVTWLLGLVHSALTHLDLANGHVRPTQWTNGL